MEKHKFRCEDCGYELFLQAWKAVCPNCNGTFTLVRMEEQPTEEKRITPNTVGFFPLLFYILYSMVAEPGKTLINLPAAVIPFLPIWLAYLPAALILLLCMVNSEYGWGAGIAIGAMGLAVSASESFLKNNLIGKAFQPYDLQTIVSVLVTVTSVALSYMALRRLRDLRLESVVNARKPGEAQ